MQTQMQRPAALRATRKKRSSEGQNAGCSVLLSVCLPPSLCQANTALRVRYLTTEHAFHWESLGLVTTEPME